MLNNDASITYRQTHAYWAADSSLMCTFVQFVGGLIYFYRICYQWNKGLICTFFNRVNKIHAPHIINWQFYVIISFLLLFLILEFLFLICEFITNNDKNNNAFNLYLRHLMNIKQMAFYHKYNSIALRAHSRFTAMNGNEWTKALVFESLKWFCAHMPIISYAADDVSFARNKVKTKKNQREKLKQQRHTHRGVCRCSRVYHVISSSVHMEIFSPFLHSVSSARHRRVSFSYFYEWWASRWDMTHYNYTAPKSICTNVVFWTQTDTAADNSLQFPLSQAIWRNFMSQNKGIFS